MHMDEKTRYWIDLAEYDLETAKVMLAGKRLLYVGFMCHQVIEKALIRILSVLPQRHAAAHPQFECPRKPERLVWQFG